MTTRELTMAEVEQVAGGATDVTGPWPGGRGPTIPDCPPPQRAPGPFPIPVPLPPGPCFPFDQSL